jgi:hypothetical protein
MERFFKVGTAFGLPGIEAANKQLATRTSNPNV